MLLKLVLFAILKNVLRSSIKTIRNVKRVRLKTVLKRYYNKKDEILQQRRDKYARFKHLDKRLKALDERLSIPKLTT